MKLPTLRIYARSPKNKEDVKRAKLMQHLLEKQWDGKKGILMAITDCNIYIERVYPTLKLPKRFWDRILEEVVKYDISEIENKTLVAKGKIK